MSADVSDARFAALALVEARLTGDATAARVLLADGGPRWRLIALVLSALLADELTDRRYGDVGDALDDLGGLRHACIREAAAGGGTREGGS